MTTIFDSLLLLTCTVDIRVLVFFIFLVKSKYDDPLRVIKTFYLATKNPSKISEKLITESKSLNYRYHSKKSITVCLHNSPTCAIKVKDETHCTETELETHCLKIF